MGTRWYWSDLPLQDAKETLREVMASLGVTRFDRPDPQYTGSDDPIDQDRRLPDFAAQLTNFGVGRQGKMPKDSIVQLRLYEEKGAPTEPAPATGGIDYRHPRRSPTEGSASAEKGGTTVASGCGIVSALMFMAGNKIERYHADFEDAWQRLDPSLRQIEPPGYIT